MVATKCIYFVVFLVCWCFALSNGRPDKFFRIDYKYLETTQSFYKIHTIGRTWFDAKTKCELEGATLFYPYDEDEALAVIGYWNKTQPLISWVHIGISTPTVKEVFETVDGMRVEEIYDKWAPGEPNNESGGEECVVMHRDGTLNDDQCLQKRPYICKRTEASLRWNVLCDIPDPEYKYYKETSRCYKFHLTPKKLEDAYITCNTEQSRLAIYNSFEEAKLLVELTNQALKDFVEEDYSLGAIHLGFIDDYERKTINREDLNRSGYVKWDNDRGRGDGSKQCSSLLRNGLLFDISCDAKFFFICEHRINALEGLNNAK